MVPGQWLLKVPKVCTLKMHRTHSPGKGSSTISGPRIRWFGHICSGKLRVEPFFSSNNGKKKNFIEICGQIVETKVWIQQQKHNDLHFIDPMIVHIKTISSAERLFRAI
jgi:hypothetical protein